MYTEFTAAFSNPPSQEETTQVIICLRMDNRIRYTCPPWSRLVRQRDETLAHTTWRIPLKLFKPHERS